MSFAHVATRRSLGATVPMGQVADATALLRLLNDSFNNLKK